MKKQLAPVERKPKCGPNGAQFQAADRNFRRNSEWRVSSHVNGIAGQCPTMFRLDDDVITVDSGCLPNC